MIRHLTESPYGDLDRAEMHRYIPKNATTILDVGCHTGEFGRSLKKIGISEVWGVEPNPVSASIAAVSLDRVIVGFFSIDSVPENFFDVIFFNDVLEHIVDPAETLKIALNKLKSGGIVVASIPNIRHVDNLLHIFLDKDFKYEKNGIRDETHLRFFTKKSIPRLFEKSGFVVQILEGINEAWWTSALLRRLAFRLFPKYLEDTKYMQFAVVASPISKN
ncbi:MAG: class I SAM-dependent methyltransferase [Glaciimonas sp.]|nr:class I SAM-dependent methyltransferase [Glaciimonas sp.]